MKLAKLPALRDIYRVNAALADQELSLAARRYEMTVERRDKLRERTRFGLLALNAASLVGLLSSLGTDWADRLEFSDALIAESLLLFMIGLMASAVAIWWSGLMVTRDAASDFEELHEARKRKAEYDGVATAEAEDNLVNRPRAEEKVPPDFRWSPIDNLLTSAAGAAWLGAVGWIAWHVAQSVEFKDAFFGFI